jgi:hypothetical protein
MIERIGYAVEFAALQIRYGHLRQKIYDLSDECPLEMDYEGYTTDIHDVAEYIAQKLASDEAEDEYEEIMLFVEHIVCMDELKSQDQERISSENDLAETERHLMWA